MSDWIGGFELAVVGYVLIGAGFVLVFWSRLARFTDEDDDEL